MVIAMFPLFCLLPGFIWDMLFCDGVNVSNWTLYLVWPGFDPNATWLHLGHVVL